MLQSTEVLHSHSLLTIGFLMEIAEGSKQVCDVFYMPCFIRAYSLNVKVFKEVKSKLCQIWVVATGNYNFE